MCGLNAGSSIADTAARTIGKYAGLQPAITALIAACSTVTDTPRCGTTPSSWSGSVTPAPDHHLEDPVDGRRHDRQPVGPALLEEVLLGL